MKTPLTLVALAFLGFLILFAVAGIAIALILGSLALLFVLSGFKWIPSDPYQFGYIDRLFGGTGDPDSETGIETRTQGITWVWPILENLKLVDANPINVRVEVTAETNDSSDVHAIVNITAFPDWRRPKNHLRRFIAYGGLERVIRDLEASLREQVEHYINDHSVSQCVRDKETMRDEIRGAVTSLPADEAKRKEGESDEVLDIERLGITIDRTDLVSSVEADAEMRTMRRSIKREVLRNKARLVLEKGLHAAVKLEIDSLGKLSDKKKAEIRRQLIDEYRRLNLIREGHGQLIEGGNSIIVDTRNSRQSGGGGNGNRPRGRRGDRNS